MKQSIKNGMEFTAGNIIETSFESFKENIKFYSLLGLIAIVIATLISTLFSEDPKSVWTSTMFLILILIGLYVKFAVTIHRSILLNEVAIRNSAYWSNNETQFMLWGFGIFISIGAIVAATIFLITTVTISGDPSPIFGLLTIVAMIVFAILSSRLAILFPSIAVGKKLSLTECWHLTGQYKGSMFALVIGFPFATNIILRLIPEEGLFWMIIGTTVSVIITIIEIIIISHAYNALVVTEPNENELNL